MLTLIVILINVGILFNYFLFERNVIYWSGLVQRRDLHKKIFFKVEALKLFWQKINVVPLGLKRIPQFLVYEGQAEQPLQQNYLRVTSNVWPPLMKWLETSLAAVGHHLFFRNPEKKTVGVSANTQDFNVAYLKPRLRRITCACITRLRHSRREAVWFNHCWGREH